MIVNGIEKIKDDAGDYLVLVDYGCEGIAVARQCPTLDEAIAETARGGIIGPVCIVRLVRFDAAEGGNL